MRLRLSDPESAHDLVRALNATDCLAARVASDSVDVFVPWLDDGGTRTEHAVAELLFFVRAWTADRPGLHVLLERR
jgi:hypothetical protein